jgi:hypothetical protein
MGCHLEVGPGCRTHSGHIPVWYTCAVRHRISKIDQNSSAQKSMTHEHHEHFWMIWMDMSILILICLCAPITAQCPHFSPQLVMNPCPCGTGPFASAAPSADREQPPAPVCIFWGALNLEKVLEMTLTWSERCPFSRQIRIHMHGYTAIHCLSLSLSTFYWVASHASYHRQAFICKIPIISAIMLLPYETRTSCSWSWILFNIVSGSFCPCWILSAVLDLFSETKIHLSQWAVPKTPVISIYLVCWYGFHIDTEMNYISHPINNLCSYSIVIPSGSHWLESPCHCSQLSNAQAPLWMAPRRRSLRHWPFRSPRVKRWQHAAHMAP